MKLLHDLWFYQGVYSPEQQGENRFLLLVFGLLVAGVVANGIAFIVRGIRAAQRRTGEQ